MVALVLLIAGQPVPAAVVALGALVVALVRAPSPASGDPDGAQEWVAQVSHELRTPLTGILGALDLIVRSTTPLDPEEAVELLSMANDEAVHMMHLVDNLRTASRLARHTLETHPQPVDPVAIAERAVERFPDVARRAHLPPAGTTAMWADPDLAMQIVTNLLQNAQRYAPSGALEISVERRNGRVALSISDEGPGVPAADAESVFHASGGKGLGLGLSLSRELARRMDGDLILDQPRRTGTTFTLLLPHADEAPERLPSLEFQASEGGIALSPRARLLVDMAAALSERSMDRTVARLDRLYTELLGATAGILVVPNGRDTWRPVGSFGTGGELEHSLSDRILGRVARTASTEIIGDLQGADLGHWHDLLGGSAAIFMPVLDIGEVVGVMAISWDDQKRLPDERGTEVATALAQIAAFAISRASLSYDVAYERGLRASVMEALPIAISVFAGDPPRLVDWNLRERRMLRLEEGIERPADLVASQVMFDVRFADGTPLTIENAPVTAAIRTGKSAGPFLLIIRRSDGSEVFTRTYCAPFFDERGKVAGAVVTSEEVDAQAGMLPPD